MTCSWLRNQWHPASSMTDQNLSSGAVLFLGHVASARLATKFRAVPFFLMNPVSFDIKISP